MELYPDLPFLDFLVFVLFKDVLVFRLFSPSFPVILGVRTRRKILVFWWFSLRFLEKKQGQEEIRAHFTLKVLGKNTLDTIGAKIITHTTFTILFKIITHIKLLCSNYLGRYSYSFRARQELIAVTVTVLWVWREYVFTVTVRYCYIKNGLRNSFPKITVSVT